MYCSNSYIPQRHDQKCIGKNGPDEVFYNKILLNVFLYFEFKYNGYGKKIERNRACLPIFVKSNRKLNIPTN